MPHSSSLSISRFLFVFVFLNLILPYTSRNHTNRFLSLSIFLLRVSKHQLAQINVIRIIFKLNINTNCPISHSHMMLMAAVPGFIFLNSSITFRSCAFISWFSHIHLPPTHLHTHTHIGSFHSFQCSFVRRFDCANTKNSLAEFNASY